VGRSSSQADSPAPRAYITRAFTGRTLSPEGFYRICRLALWSLVGIVVSGAAVRLTDSGLGCADWPHCDDDQLIPAADLHGWIEFGNRLVTGVVSIAVILAVLGARHRAPIRHDLIRWAWGLVGGVLGQILLGAITVRTHLSPPVVMSHFLLSIVLVWNSVILTWRANPQPVPSRPPLPTILVRLTWISATLATIVIFTGTIVTAAGPHGGDETAKRLDIAIPSAARVHGITVVALVSTVVLIGILARRIPSAERIRRRADMALGWLLVQAGIGYLQYFNDVPPALVGLHIAGATLGWIAVLRLVLATRTQPNPPHTSDANPQLLVSP
jgi:cytochrome c oxidase assembly protein subunit 15